MSSEVSSSTIGVSDTSIVDSRSPYYLNNGDNPGIHLVTKPLSGDNYHTWSRSMSLALSSKNKLGFVIGTVPQPNDPSYPLYDLWTRCNDLVLSWITSCLAEHISASVIYIKTAKGVWDDLKERYSQSNGPRVFHLKQAISSLKQEQYDVSSYYTVLKSLWDEFLNYRPIPGCSCGAKCICDLSKTLTNYQHYDYVLSFLMGLNESFAQVRSQLLLMEPLPSINKVFALVQQEEKQRGVGILPLPTVGSTALLSRMDNTIVPYNGNAVSTTYNGIQFPMCIVVLSYLLPIPRFQHPIHPTPQLCIMVLMDYLLHTFLEWIMVDHFSMVKRIGPLAHTVDLRVTLWINVTSSMVIHLALKERTKFLLVLLIKSLVPLFKSHLTILKICLIWLINVSNFSIC